jgi:hypothetical protein
MLRRLLDTVQLLRKLGFLCLLCSERLKIVAFCATLNAFNLIRRVGGLSAALKSLLISAIFRKGVDEVVDTH